MRRILAWGAIGAIALAPLSACAAPGGGGGDGPAVEAGAPCAPLEDDGIDYARVTPDPTALGEAVARASAEHARLRSAVGLTPQPTGDSIRILSWGSMLPGNTSLVATPDGAGGWTVERVTTLAFEPGKDRQAGEPRLSRGKIDGPAAQDLSRRVADQCLYREPTYFGRTVPTTDGGQASCADGADAVVEITVAGRRHAAFHACHTFGRVAEVAAPLWQAGD